MGIQISLKFVPNGPTYNQTLVNMITLFEAMMAYFTDTSIGHSALVSAINMAV